VPPEQIHRIEKTVAAPLRVPTLREAASGLLWAWLGGLLFFVGMVMRDLVRLRRLRQTLVPCTSPAAVGLLDEAARSVGLTQPPRLFESAAVPVPVVIGPINPVVVLPAGMANTLDREKLTAVLLHEAAHVVHGDLWVGLLQHAVAAIFWWCPPVHRLNRRLAEVREEICDDYVVLAQGDGFQLAEVLVEMAAGLRGSRQRLTIGTLGAIDEKPALEGRVERLIDLTRKAAPVTRMNRLAVVSGSAFGLVALAIVLATTIHAADEPPAAEPKVSVLRHTGSMVSHVDFYGSGTGVSERLKAAGQMGVGFKYGDPSKTSWKGNLSWSLLRNEGNADVYAFELEFIPEGGAPVRQVGKLSFDGESPALVVVNDQWAISIEPEQPQRPEK
jgi:beta-lactamase regulating signal transducer with metallopeptidase domain